MPFLALLTRDPDVERAVRRSLEERNVVARAGHWGRLRHLIRERPVTCVILDEGGLPRLGGAPGAVAGLKARYPSLPLVLVARPEKDPFALLQLGRAGIDQLVLVHVDDLEREGVDAVGRALAHTADALVTRVLSPYLPPRAVTALRMAMEGVQQRWDACTFAGRLGLSRPHLSVCLKAAGLPSAGHLQVWARLLHAGHWLSDAGRSAESVARQLDYSSGAAFRRALRSYTGATPTEVIAHGGLSFVLGRFLAHCGLSDPRRDRSVA